MTDQEGTTVATGSAKMTMRVVFMVACIILRGRLAALAANDLPTVEGPAGDAAAGHWTSDRLKRAEPLPLPRATAGFRPEQALPENALPSREPRQPSVESQAEPPSVKVRARRIRLFYPDLSNPTSDSNDGLFIKPEAVGTAGAYFTSSRVFANDRVFPYSAVGKLFFNKPNGVGYLCSGAVIKPRLILTAGHCVHDGKSGASGWNNSFSFVPAFRSGVAPYQRWSYTRAWTTNTWFNGGGTVPNAADYAIIEVADQPFNGVVRRIGDVTGLLGYKTQSLLPNHADILGYPGNLDSGSIMHQVTAASFRTSSPNAAEYGSDMGGGSSGGPWIQNFGQLSNGQTDYGTNQIVGVTSYGPLVSGPHYQGSSILDSRFLDLVNTGCNSKTGNC